MLSASQETSAFWIVAVPSTAASSRKKQPETPEEWANEAKLTRRELDMKTQKYAELHTFHIPKLRVGTLDSLMTLSDELGKMDMYVESVAKKTAKTYAELKGSETLMVEGESAERYVETFKWNMAKYPTGAQLNVLAKGIETYVTSCDEDLRKKVNKYLEIQQSLSAIERKSMGTLLVKDLRNIVKPTDLIDREYLTSIILVLPKQKEEHFLATYEQLEDIIMKRAGSKKKKKGGDGGGGGDGDDDGDDDNDDDEKDDGGSTIKSVVPRSALKLASDPDFCLYRVVVFKKGVDSYRNLCRAERWTVRDYVHSSNSQDDEKMKMNTLTAEKNKVLGSLILWCETNYSEVFGGWLHLKAIRVFVESVLRFGIPVNFQSVVVRPRKGFRTKLNKVLEEMYSHLAGPQLGGAEDKGDVFTGVDAEFYPYVYMGVNIGEPSSE